jgi:hypothetical protein
MKRFLKYSQEEYAALTCQIKEIESRIEFLRDQKLKDQFQVSIAVPEQRCAQIIKTEPFEVSHTADNSEDLLLLKVDDVLAKATAVINNKDAKKPQLKHKCNKKMNPGKQVIPSVDPSKSKRSCSRKMDKESQVPPKISGSLHQDSTSIDYDSLLRKRRKRLQSKYLKLSKVLDKLSICQKNFCGLIYCAESEEEMKSFPELPQELNCIHRILCHILESYVIPGNYSVENIKAITKKTDEQFAALTENLYSQQNIRTAESLLVSAYNSNNFREESVAEKLKVVAFSRRQQITRCMVTYGKIFTARMYSELLQELLSIVSLSSLAEDLELLQLTKFILSDRMFIPPVVYRCNSCD